MFKILTNFSANYLLIFFVTAFLLADAVAEGLHHIIDEKIEEDNLKELQVQK